MSVLTRATLLNIPEDAILHSHRRENLKSYKMGPVIKNVGLIGSVKGTFALDTRTEAVTSSDTQIHHCSSLHAGSE
jgi:hypothetical protein